MAASGDWKYCVAGNILKTRVDENLNYRNGTTAFKGGAKVYLNGRYHDFGYDSIDVLGLTRGHRFQVIRVSLQLIENVRLQRVYKPRVLQIMNDWEFHDTWWHDTEDDRKDAERFIEEWKQYID